MAVAWLLRTLGPKLNYYMMDQSSEYCLEELNSDLLDDIVDLDDYCWDDVKPVDGTSEQLGNSEVLDDASSFIGGRALKSDVSIRKSQSKRKVGGLPSRVPGRPVPTKQSKISKRPSNSNNSNSIDVQFKVLEDQMEIWLQDLEKAKDQEQDITAKSELAESLPTGVSIPISDAMNYFAELMAAINKGSYSELRVCIDRICASNCRFRSTNVKFNDSEPFADRNVPREAIFDLLKGMVDAFPDSYWKVEAPRLRQGRLFNSIVGHYIFKSTLLKSIFNSEIQAKFPAEDLEQEKELHESRPDITTIESCGMYSLTLNADNLIEYLDLIYVAEQTASLTVEH